MNDKPKGLLATVGSILIPLVAAPGVAFMLRLIPYFKLSPLVAWPDYTDATLTILPALVGAAIGLLIPRKSAGIKPKVIAISVSGLLAFNFPFLYNSITDNPPSTSN